MSNLDRLRESGMNIDELPAEQQAALEALDQSEVDALVSIREKLNTDPEVTGHMMSAAQFSGVRTPESLVSRALADGTLIW